MTAASKQSTNTGLRLLVLGGTGLVGSNFLIEAQNSSAIREIVTISRRSLPLFATLSKVSSILESDSTKWAGIIEEMDTFDIVFSAIGRVSHQRLHETVDRSYADYGLNMELATAAKSKGTKIFMMVTCLYNSILANWIPYFTHKQNLEKSLIRLDFDQTIILRPGPLIGERNLLDPGQVTDFTTSMSRLFYNSCCSWILEYPIHGHEVAKAGIHLLENKHRLHKVKFSSSDEMLHLAAAYNAD